MLTQLKKKRKLLVKPRHARRSKSRPSRDSSLSERKLRKQRLQMLRLPRRTAQRRQSLTLRESIRPLQSSLQPRASKTKAQRWEAHLSTV